MMRRAECLIIQIRFIFSPGADLERHRYLEVLEALKAGAVSQAVTLGGGAAATNISEIVGLIFSHSWS